MITPNQILHGDVLEKLKELSNNSVDCIVTSPPYYGLRDYGIAGQLGTEKTYQEYLAKLLSIFGECKRVLKSSGVLWVNLGDSYVGNKLKTLASKTLIGIPDRFKTLMIDDGWLCRNDIIWQKPNGFTQSAYDRYTVNYERIFLFAKSGKYFYNTQYEPITEKMQTYIQKNKPDLDVKKLKRLKRAIWEIKLTPFKGAHFATFPEDLVKEMLEFGCPKQICSKCLRPREMQYRRQKHGVGYQAIKGVKPSGKWDNTSQCNGKSDIRNGYVIELTEIGLTDCGCNAGWTPGLVLDPFMGSGTTAVVAKKLGMEFLGIELNPEYIKMAYNRLS